LLYKERFYFIGEYAYLERPGDDYGYYESEDKPGQRLAELAPEGV
jgi:hypothetical protein